MSIRFLGPLLGWLLLTAAGARADERPIVAVFQIQLKMVQLDAGTLDALTDYLAAAVSEGGHLRVVPPGDIRSALKAKQAESYQECYEQACQIELGRELAANKTLATSVLKLGDKCTVTASLYDLKTQATDRSAMADAVDCTPGGLKAAIAAVAERISGRDQPTDATDEPQRQIGRAHV
jgi:hypothetical protein